MRPYEETVRALYDLSDFNVDMDINALFDIIASSPDPDTACSTVVECMIVRSEILKKKWHQAIRNAWSICHPNIPVLPSIPISAHDVDAVEALQDALSFLESIEVTPGVIVKDQQEIALSPDDVLRMAKVLPSLRNDHGFGIEHEWNCLPVRRLRSTLQALRLVRIYQGQLVIVRSRYERFKSLPPAWQYYCLWHTETYHLSWGDFAGQWGPYLNVVQGYLPLLWDVVAGVEEDTMQDGHEWAADIVELFMPLWEEEGVMGKGRGKGGIVSLYRQVTLPSVIKKVVLQDLLMRYGLVKPEYDPSLRLLYSQESADEQKDHFIWTKLGAAMASSERKDDLHCGIELLDAKGVS